MAAASTSSSVPIQKKPNEAAIKDWTQEEKFNLLKALKAFGRHNIKNIQKHVCTKNFEETKAAVEYYTGVALQNPNFVKETEQKPKRSRQPRSPLADWAKLLTDNLNYSELRTETATAIRMIADLEKIPARDCTEGIDFRQVYHQIANAMEGKPLTPDMGTSAVLHKCLVETALSSKAFIKSAAFKYVINNIDLSDKDINMFPRPTEDHELANLRHLASQRSYNPLKVPEDLLKPLP